MASTVQDVTFPSAALAAITPNDTTDLAVCVRQIYVGTYGDVKVQDNNGTVITFKNASEGSVLGPFFVKRIYATGTTATNLVGFI